MGADTRIDLNGKPHHPQRVLFLSDAHIGHKISQFPSYHLKLIELMTQYDHVVMNGDNFEMFYVDSEHAGHFSTILEALVPGSNRHEWMKREFDPSKSKKEESGIHRKVENMIHGGRLFLSRFLEQHPNVHVHFVLGNHEKVRKFKHMLDELQYGEPEDKGAHRFRGYSNFEWHPEAIRIGDALVTHGHLPLGGRNDEEHADTRLREATNKHRWTALFAKLDGVAHEYMAWKRPAHKTTKLVLEQLLQWENTGKFHYSHDGKHYPLTLEWMKHLFTGHTHHRFVDYQMKADDLPKSWSGKSALNDTQIDKALSVHSHNTGAIVETAGLIPSDLGIIEATLLPDGALTDIGYVQGIMKNKHYIPAAMPVATGRR